MKILLLLLSMPILLFSSIGNVVAVKGSVIIKRHRVSIFVKDGSAIEKKDSIITKNRSRVQIILKDQTIVTIGENSNFSFDEYKFHTKNDSKLKMKLNYGFFRVITGKIGKIAPEHFKVQSKSATIGIRGTHFYGLVRNKIEKYGCIRGRISILTKEAKKINLIAGQMLTFGRNKVWEKGSIKQGSIEKQEHTLNKSITSTHTNIDQVQQNILIQEPHHKQPNHPSLPVPPLRPEHPVTGASGGS